MNCGPRVIMAHNQVAVGTQNKNKKTKTKHETKFKVDKEIQIKAVTTKMRKTIK